MADVHTKETCSYNMSRIKGKNTKPEMLVRKFLHKHGFHCLTELRSSPFRRINGCMTNSDNIYSK
ncbi:MAG: hypothetical protein ACR2KZ_11465 [Segetibacter sp.]